MILSSIFIGLLIFEPCLGSIFDWFSWTSEPPQNFTSGIYFLNIPFEELAPEEKFLIEASKITGLKLDQLDVCQHKLIVKLKSSCGSLSDEELSKLAVNLLNCQADVEGRRTYPCNQGMRLGECTREMDGDTWNAYHILSNRARAVCYAARQEQFRALSELTVNRLLGVTREQTALLASLNENQKKLGEVSEVALNRISRSQHEVLVTYSRLRRLENELSERLTGHSGAVSSLSALVESRGGALLALLDHFNRSIGETESTLKSQRKEHLLEHDKILSGLTIAQESVEHLKTQVGAANKLSSDGMKKTASQFTETDTILKSLNTSLARIQSRLETLEKIIDSKTSFALSLTGAHGENLDLMFLLAAHVLCLASAMLITCFLDLPRHLRALLVAMAMVNGFLHYSDHEYALHLSHHYLLYSLLTAVDLIVIVIFKFFHSRQQSKEASLLPKVSPQKTTVTAMKGQNGFREPLTKVSDWLTEKNFQEDRLNGYGRLAETPLTGKAQDEVSVCSQPSTRSRRNISPSRSVADSSTSSRRCSAIRPNGQRCKLRACVNNIRCQLHR